MSNLILKFSHNWNNKLGCKFYTSIRLSNDTKYLVGHTYDVYLKGQLQHTAQIVNKKKLFIKDISDYIAGLDTGYSKEECIKMIRIMYTKVKDLDNKRFDFILLKQVTD